MPGRFNRRRAAACRRSPRATCRRPSRCRSVEENLGPLSNDEVLAVLKDREADKQPVVSRATPSEIQVGCCSHRRRRRKCCGGLPLGGRLDCCVPWSLDLLLSANINMAGSFLSVQWAQQQRLEQHCTLAAHSMRHAALRPSAGCSTVLPFRALSLQAYTALLAQNGGSFKDREALQAFIDDVKVCWVLACMHAWAAHILSCRLAFGSHGAAACASHVFLASFSILQ